MELDELTYQNTISPHQMVEALTKVVEQIIQFLEQLTEQELDEVAAGMSKKRGRDQHMIL